MSMMVTITENVSSFENLDSQLERGYAQIHSSSHRKETGVHLGQVININYVIVLT